GVRGEHAAAAQTRDAQPVGLDDARGFLEPHRLHLVAPGRDGGDAVAQAAVDHFAEAPAIAQGREVDGDLAVRHHTTPCTARTRRIRSTASSGSARTRAWSARRKSWLRCWSERADCWPPIMAK